MSFYSYKNANSECSPGMVNGSILNGLNQRVCIQVKNVYDSCLSQEQLDDEVVTIENIVPVLPSFNCKCTNNKSCACSCTDNKCSCTCPGCGTNISHAEAVENATKLAEGRVGFLLLADRKDPEGMPEEKPWLSRSIIEQSIESGKLRTGRFTVADADTKNASAFDGAEEAGVRFQPGRYSYTGLQRMRVGVEGKSLMV